MQRFKGFMIGLIVCSLFHIWVFGFDNWAGHLTLKMEGYMQSAEKKDTPSLIEQVKESDSGEEIDEAAPAFSEQYTELSEYDVVGPDVILSIGMSEENIVQVMGEPDRKEPSAYGYEWWIYNDDLESYIQLGINHQGELVTLYTNAADWEWNSLSPGMSRDDWQTTLQIEDNVSFYHQLGYYSFGLTKEEVEQRPLYVKGDVAAQIYIDIHDEDKISGIRLMTLDVLLYHRPYTLSYTGTLPAPPEPSETEWSGIEEAYEKQIIDVLNVFRLRHRLSRLEWHDDVADVAKGHSFDMLTEDFFDHVSPGNGNLEQRLSKKEVRYQLAGENIAWNYVDGVDAHEGWVNSLGHRKNLIQEQYEYLGVGVIKKYYTQNFISK